MGDLRGNDYIDGGREIGQKVAIGFVEAEPGGEGLDRAAERRGGDGAGGIVVGFEGESREGVQVDDGLSSGYQDGSIRLTDIDVDFHFGRVEDAHEGAAGPELITFLGVAPGALTPDAFEGDHAADARAQLELVGVTLLAFDDDLLTVALEFQDATFGRFGEVMCMIRPLQAGHMFPRVIKFDLVFLLVDFAEDGTFPDFDFGLVEIGLGLLEIGSSLFGVVAMFGGLLFDLVFQIVVLGFAFAEELQFIGAVEFSEDLTGFDYRSVGDELGEGEIAASAFDPRHLDGSHIDRLDGSGGADGMGRGSRSGSGERGEGTKDRKQDVARQVASPFEGLRFVRVRRWRRDFRWCKSHGLTLTPLRTPQ